MCLRKISTIHVLYRITIYVYSTYERNVDTIFMYENSKIGFKGSINNIWKAFTMSSQHLATLNLKTHPLVRLGNGQNGLFPPSDLYTGVRSQSAAQSKKIPHFIKIIVVSRPANEIIASFWHNLTSMPILCRSALTLLDIESNFLRTCT